MSKLTDMIAATPVSETTTIDYEVQEYLPGGDKWVTAFNDHADPEDALRVLGQCRDAMSNPEHFRVAKIVNVTTVEVIA